jgi:LAS superfamily LD-carboxypeptidase LdcB
VTLVSLSMEQLLGLVDTHVVRVDTQASIGNAWLHPVALDAFMALRAAAHEAGFDLRIVSGFRSFARQAEIWNAKASGMRPVLDASERPLDISGLSDIEKLMAILRWSALPGASRHHWGTDADIVDAAAMSDGYQVQLRIDECRGRGPFAPMHRWLDQRIEQNGAFGFFRPYTGVGCSVAPEPWHLSYAPLARQCQQALDPARLCLAHREMGIALCDAIARRCDDLLARFHYLPDVLYPGAAAAPRLLQGGHVSDA